MSGRASKRGRIRAWIARGRPRPKFAAWEDRGRTYVSFGLAMQWWHEAGCRPRFRRFIRRLHDELNPDGRWVKTRGKPGWR